MTDTVIDAISAPLPKNYRRRWRRVLWRTVQSMTSMDTSMRCAGVAYFGFLSMIPAVATVVLLIGLFAKPSFLADMVGRLDGLVPAVALEVLAGQLVALLDQPRAGLGIGLLISSVIAIWSGSRGVAALMFATSRTRSEPEKRNIVSAVGISILTTLLAGLGMIAVLTLVAVVPAYFTYLPWLGTHEVLVLLLRWPLCWVLASWALLPFIASPPTANPTARAGFGLALSSQRSSGSSPAPFSRFTSSGWAISKRLLALWLPPSSCCSGCTIRH